MSKERVFPKLKKSISSFIKDEEGTILRNKAAVVGPLVVGAIVLMSKDLDVEASTPRFVSHVSHTSHASHSSNYSNDGYDWNTETTQSDSYYPAHSSHSSGTVSGFSHTVGTLTAENRGADNN